MKERIFIFDKYDKLLAITHNYVEAVFEETVEKPVSFTITFPMSDDDASYLIGGNQVAFKDLTGKFRLFTIREVDDVDGESSEKIVQCMPAMQELADVMVENNALESESADVVLGAILKKSRWLVGNVADLGLNTISFSYQNAYMCLGKLTELWGGEIVDRVEIAGNKIAGRYLDIVQRKGADTGKRFEMDKDIKNITRTVLYYPKTALYGHGKSIQSEKEGTGKITFRNVEWIKENGDPTNKPKGQEWVGDPDALEKHGVPNHETGKLMHRFGLFEDNEEEDPERLLDKTWQAVQHEKDPKVQYEMDIITFYGIADYEHEQVFLGDTGIARDKDMKPMILIEARIMSWEYDIGNPRDGSLVLGNILDLDPDDSEIEWVIDKVKEGSGNWDAGGDPITDERFPDIVPDAPQNVSAIGLFKKIMLSWTFESTYMIAAYEVYASQMNGFVPDSTNLVFRGKVGAYNFDANTDEKWYFRVRAVNTHGTASEYSEQVSASTVQLDLPDIENIVPDFIEYGIYKGEESPSSKDYKYWLDISKEPNILRHWDEESETWKPLAPEYAGDIGAVSLANYHEQVNEIIADIADKADLGWVNGQLVSKANKDDIYTMEQLDNKFDNVVPKTTYESDKQGIITDLRDQESRITQTEKDIKTKVSNTQYQQDKKSLETSINENKSSIEQNAKAIVSKVSSSQYKADKEGIIKDIKENQSKIEQNANRIKSKVDATYVQGEIGKIEVGGRNLLPKTSSNFKNVTFNDWDRVLGVYEGITVGETYTGRVYLKPHNYPVKLNLDFRTSDDLGYSQYFSAPVPVGKEGYRTVTMVAPKLASSNGKPITKVRLSIRKDKREYNDVKVDYKEEKLEKGNKATDWMPAPEDTEAKIEAVKQHTSEIEQTAKGIKQEVTALETDYSTFKNQTNSTIKQHADQIASKVTKTEYNADIGGLRAKVSKAESTIKQNADNILTKVNKNGVVSSINQSPEQIKISANRVSIDGDLVVRNGKVYIKDGVITNKLIAGNAKIDGAKIADATITSAKISNISADKIRTGILDASKVSIRVKNGIQAIQIDDKGFESIDSKGNVRIHIGIRDIAGKGQSDPSTIRFFSGNGSNVASIGMNVNDDFIIGSQNRNVSMSLYSGKSMLYWANSHKFAFNNGPNSNFWHMTAYKDADGHWHPRLFSERYNSGYVGISSRPLWQVYSSNINETSTKKAKTNINHCDVSQSYRVLQNMDIKRYNGLNCKGEADSNEKYGVIAEEAPIEILDVSGNAVNLYSMISHVANVVKDLINRIDNLEKTVKGWS
ncbi:MAG: phage tail protein [Virgibacillus proomii]